MELCKRKRINEDILTLSKGKVERKEGEKRRTPAFRRGVRQKNKGKNALRKENIYLIAVSYLQKHGATKSRIQNKLMKNRGNFTTILIHNICMKKIEVA